ncbi:MAG: TlpA family protein disulfide reductase [Gammaproteobacteria bacterium]|nr:TlpA family protein disulfide reductase [Gammaproteobacteria bacterium]
MKQTPKRLFLGLTLLLITALVVSLWSELHTPRQAANVVFKTITGEQIRLSELRGRPVLINFWASTCAYCLEEMPHLAEFYRQQKTKTMQIIGVAMPYDMPSRVVQLSRQLQLPYPVAIDPDATVTTAFGNIRYTPTSILINSNGYIIDTITGQIDLDQLRKLINQQSEF